MKYSIDLEFTIVDGMYRHTAKDEKPQELRLTDEQLPLKAELLEGLETYDRTGLKALPLQIALRQYLMDAVYYKQILSGTYSTTSLQSVEIHKIIVTTYHEEQQQRRVKLDRLMTAGELLSYYENVSRRKRLKQSLKVTPPTTP